MEFQDHLVPETEPIASDDAIVQGPDYRFTVLTPRLIRLEYAPDGSFEDRATQSVWFRDLPVPEFSTTTTEQTVTIETDRLRLRYDRTGEGFDGNSLSIELLEEGETWTPEEEVSTLGGALRTVDTVDGATDLEEGLVSRDGWTVVDETSNLVFEDEGWVQPRDRADEYEDLYFFGYGQEYRSCLEDFTQIAGDAPMLPRWALGNWWSRYWAYTQDELRDLMAEFQERELPLSVCMIDMDWHVVENDYHYGWTGWTWNDEYFPDPESFTDWLHENDLRTGLNLHPAKGVHPHEDQYEDFAESMDIDPASEQPIEFDASDTDFLQGYFEHLIHPMEEEDGIDFWWIDWQQWKESPEMPGLDPMWALNHLHALDRTRDGRRPFILSRWSGLGGHRYPVGFSGDAHVSWESLQFQPYLTASSANVDYGWWSHDIGGHIGGTGDPIQFGELYTRWLQFGVFSPINRIHTTKDPFIDKRPWKFGDDIYSSIEDAMRLRHALVPYIYTMAWRNHEHGYPLIEPLYYDHPDEEAAYHCPQEYSFGTELIVAPHIHPRDEDTNLSRRGVWLPDGDWFDFVSGRHYDGGWHARYGGLDDLPVYAEAGAIVPLGPDGAWDCNSNPETLRLFVFPGDDNTFELYEDDGTSLEYEEGAYTLTELSQRWDGDQLEFEIEPAAEATQYVPDTRTFELHFRAVTDPENVEIDAPVEHQSVTYHQETSTVVVELTDVPADEEVTVSLETEEESLISRKTTRSEEIERLLRTFAMPTAGKIKLRRRLEEDPTDFSWIDDFAVPLEPAHVRALVESLLDIGIEYISEVDRPRIVLWNESQHEDVRFQFSAWDRTGSPLRKEGDSRGGTLPSFEVIDLGEYDTHDWEFSAMYGGVVTVTHDNDPATE